MDLERKITRRKFLKGAAATGFTLMFPERSPFQELEEKINKPIYWGNRRNPNVALTFDDGYSPSSIQRALDAFSKAKIFSTFFIIGQQLETYPLIWQKAIEDGHQICNHTYNHSYLTQLKEDEIRSEVNLWEKAAKKILGERYFKSMKESFPFIRFPGGAGHNDLRVLRIITELEYQPIAWSTETYAAVLKKHLPLKEKPPEPIAKEITNHLVATSENGIIILLHFNIWDTLTLPQTIQGIQDKNLQIHQLQDII